MEKNRIRPIKTGKSFRMSYSRQEEVLEMPNLIEVQKDSYKWFLDEGLKEVFDDISPIADYSGHLSLEFVDFTLCEDDVKYTIDECKERDATYAAPLKVRVRLYNKENDEINEHEIFMGDLPLMTKTGTFVINGAERVIVSQLVRSPGIYYGIAHDKFGKKLYSATVIPNRGAWLEYETDSNDVFYVRVDRTRKVPITVLIRALGIGTNAEIIDLFGEEPKILASFTKDTSESYQEGLLELYKKIRPGEPLAVDSAESLITSMFFDPRRYDLAKVGRYKFNKKLNLKNRVTGQVLAEDVVSAVTGEVVAEKGTKITRELAGMIQNSAAPYIWVEGEDESRNIKVLSNLMVDLQSVVDIDPAEVGVTEQVYYPVLAGIIEESAGDVDEMKRMIKRDLHDLIPKHITKEDILVLAGSIPNTLPEDIYEKILARLESKGIRVVVDATKDLLLNVLKYHPFLIKPNNHELGEMFGTVCKTDEDIIHYAKKLQEMGAVNVLISMAGDGAILLDEHGKVYQGRPPKGEVLNSVGAGDSMVAGFVTGYLNTGDYEKAFELGIATGSASAFEYWLAEKEDVVKLLEKEPELYGL